MSRYLLDESPLVIQPSLAQLIGLNEAIIVQQLHYWLLKSENVRDGRKWVYNTYKEWQEQFPFWSEITVRRTLTNLEKAGIIITGNYNEMRADKTKWYTINYEKLEGMISPCDQNDQSMRSKRSDGCDQNDQSNTIYYTDITTDIEIYNIPFDHIIDYLNEKAGTKYRASSRKTKDLIKARWNEGFRIDDFKRVIDNKVSDWGNDPYWSKFLRPETLFSNKFEGYLNQKPMRGGKQHVDQRGISPDREELYRRFGIE